MAMDKPPVPARPPKSKLFKFLPKAAPSAISFHNPPFSPGRSEHLAATKIKPHPRSGLSVVPPSRAHRRNHPNSSGDYNDQEPTSPKISCMGQIKSKNVKKKIGKKGVTSAIEKSKASSMSVSMSMPKNFKSTAAATTHKPNVLKRIFGRGGGGGGGGGGGKAKPSFRKSKSDLSADVSSSRISATNKAPKLSQMQRFSSGRESLVGFDWTEHFPPEKVEHRRRELNYYSDEERDREGASDEEDGEPIIPFSAPLVGGGGGGGGGFCLQPRKEINLWKRRTMVQPRPLQLNKIS